MLDAVKEMRRLSFHLVGKNCFHINAEHAGKIFCCWNALYLAVLRCCLADYVKILQQNACRMCSTTSFPHSTIRVSDLWRCLWPLSLSFLNLSNHRARSGGSVGWASVLSSTPAGQTLRFLKYFSRKCCFIFKSANRLLLDFQVFSDKDYEPEVPSHNPCCKITVGC